MSWRINLLCLTLALVHSVAFGQTGGSITDNPVANPATSNSNAGTATPNLGSQLNQGVIDSQANNEKYYQQALQNSSAPKNGVIQPSADGAMIATPDGPAQGTQLNLTDQEKRLSEEYVHDGKALREQEEMCAQLDDPDACRGKTPDSKFMGMDSNMVMALSKAYTMVVGMMGGASGGIKMKNASVPEGTKVGPDDAVSKSSSEVDGVKTESFTNEDGVTTTKTTDANGKVTEKTEGKKEKDRQDYCKYIAIGVEAVAMFQTQLTKQNAEIPAGKDTAQKEILYKAARTHQDRAKSHKFQFGGWAATAGCYGLMLATGADPSSVGIWLKLGGSLLLTEFFRQQAELNEGYYDKVKAIADKLPGKGDCNPVTDKECYCAQEETRNDPTYCLPQFHNNKVKLGNYRVACIDANSKVDPKCTCINADACLDNKIMNKLKPFGIGTAFNSAAVRPISNISRGQLDSRDLASAKNGELAAFNKRTIDKFGNEIPASGVLNAKEQDTVKELGKFGVAPKLAAIMAKQKGGPGVKSNFARFRGGRFGGRSTGRSSFNKRRGKVISFSGGRGANGKRKKKAAANPFARFGKKKANKKRGGKVLNYQSRALSSAQINKDKNRPIFEIISRRYQVSGFKRLEVNR
ncbi:MAG: hypothetical protein CME70_09275 [Halobacteriovorax sp.]|nr:hypothetical protein [Halobacteriovorax sp.]|tara:strand:+ start:218286 stop:220190 length:1905 start_codon:yes stop_codon:yes gene_type:complete